MIASAAPRLNDTLYNVIDSNTNESVTYIKTTTFHDGTDMTDAKVNGVTYVKDNLSGEYFKRILPLGKINAAWWGYKSGGGSADSATNTTALQAAINYANSLNNSALIEPKSIEVLIPEGDSYCGSINLKPYVHIRGAGKTATRIYYTGNDYFLKGIVGGITQGGMSDLSVISSGGLSNNKGLIHLINAYDMHFYNLFLGGSVYGSQVTEAAVFLESKFTWFAGFNNNTYNIIFEHSTIYGSGGYGFLLNGDYGSDAIVVRDCTIENTTNNIIRVTTTASVAHTNVMLQNLTLQGCQESAVALGWVSGLKYIDNYIEVTNNKPAILVGLTGKPVINALFHNCNIGTGNTFGGAVFKGGADPSDGAVFANQGIELSKISVLGHPTDILIDMAASSVTIKDIDFKNGMTKVFKSYDATNGNWIVDLTNRLNDNTTQFTIANTGEVIKNGAVSRYFGYTFQGHSLGKLRTLDVIGAATIGGAIYRPDTAIEILGDSYGNGVWWLFNGETDIFKIDVPNNRIVSNLAAWYAGGADNADNKLVTKGEKRAAAQADSTATTIAGLKDDFNALLAKMRTADLLAT